MHVLSIHQQRGTCAYLYEYTLGQEGWLGVAQTFWVALELEPADEVLFLYPSWCVGRNLVFVCGMIVT
jgi:hypothetical protein